MGQAASTCSPLGSMGGSGLGLVRLPHGSMDGESWGMVLGWSPWLGLVWRCPEQVLGLLGHVHRAPFKVKLRCPGGGLGL